MKRQRKICKDTPHYDLQSVVLSYISHHPVIVLAGVCKFILFFIFEECMQTIPRNIVCVSFPLSGAGDQGCDLGEEDSKSQLFLTSGRNPNLRKPTKGRSGLTQVPKNAKPPFQPFLCLFVQDTYSILCCLRDNPHSEGQSNAFFYFIPPLPTTNQKGSVLLYF